MPGDGASGVQTVPVNPVDPAAALRRQADAQVALGDQALAIGDAARAAAAYTQALRIDPGDLEAALKLGRAREAQTDFEAAARAYEQAMKIAPGSPAPWLERGASYAVQGRFQYAVNDYTQAIGLDPSDPAAYFNRGAAYEGLKQASAAIADYSAALRLKPDSIAALLARGRLTAASDPKAARADYESVLALPASAADQQLARDRIKALGTPAVASAPARVFVQYRDAADLKQVEALRSALAATLKPATIAPAERVSSSSSGDVRYFFAADEPFARKVLGATELLLAKQGVRAELKLLRRDAKEFPRATAGTVELWLPSLTTTQPLPRSSLPQRALPSYPPAQQRLAPTK